MRRAMGHRNVLIRTYVLEEITIKLSGTLRKAGISGRMKLEIEQFSYWPITRSVHQPIEFIEQNVRPVK
jgi:hypothetical protein